ncbi:hypothetical protein PRIPAC_76592, partial [Pristionchus pacificus]|uniref:Uncharacterized protein n=1 Tax=Pristionchus pacificus TaxID=54126 RepID=A0A2A6B4M5_PRIPA
MARRGRNGVTSPFSSSQERIQAKIKSSSMALNFQDFPTRITIFIIPYLGFKSLLTLRKGQSDTKYYFRFTQISDYTVWKICLLRLSKMLGFSIAVEIPSLIATMEFTKGKRFCELLKALISRVRFNSVGLHSGEKINRLNSWLSQIKVLQQYDIVRTHLIKDIVDIFERWNKRHLDKPTKMTSIIVIGKRARTTAPSSMKRENEERENASSFALILFILTTLTVIHTASAAEEDILDN